MRRHGAWGRTDGGVCHLGLPTSLLLLWHCRDAARQARWPVFVTPGLPRGGEMSSVYEALLPYPTSSGENGGSYDKNTPTGVCAGFICAACICLQPGEMNSEQLGRRWVVAEHHGMQVFGVSWGQGEASSLTPMDKSSSPILSCWAVPPAHGSIHPTPWAWLGVGQPRQSQALWGVSSGAAPTPAWELGARGMGESEGVHGAAAPLCCRCRERQGTGDAHVCLHLGRREEKKDWREQNFLWWPRQPGKGLL